MTLHSFTVYLTRKEWENSVDGTFLCIKVEAENVELAQEIAEEKTGLRTAVIFNDEGEEIYP